MLYNMGRTNRPVVVWDAPEFLVEIYVQHTANIVTFRYVLRSVHGSHRSLRALLSQRNPGPSLWTPSDWKLCLSNATNTAPSTPETPGCCETLCTRIETEMHVWHMPIVAIHVISHSVHRAQDRWYFVSRRPAGTSALPPQGTWVTTSAHLQKPIGLRVLT